MPDSIVSFRYVQNNSTDLPKYQRAEDYESESRQRRSTIVRFVWKSYWRSEIRLEDWENRENEGLRNGMVVRGLRGVRLFWQILSERKLPEGRDGREGRTNTVYKLRNSSLENNWRDTIKTVRLLALSSGRAGVTLLKEITFLGINKLGDWRKRNYSEIF